MNIRDLQYLVAVHDLGNFSKAAESCYVSQPTLSGQVKKLEEDLNAALIERSTRQVLFTPLGEQIVEQAREILRLTEHIRDLAKQNDNPMAGDFHIGLIPTIAPFLLPKIMPELGRRYKEARLFLYEMKTDTLISKLLAGDIDAAILAKLDWHYSVQELPLYTESMRLAVASSDELARAAKGKKRNVPRSVLDGRSVLMLEDGHCLRDQAMGVCFEAGANEDKRFQATSMDTLLHMVATGAGITLVPELASTMSVPNITFLPFSDPKPSREVVMLIRKNSVRPEALRRIAELVTDTVGLSM